MGWFNKKIDNNFVSNDNAKLYRGTNYESQDRSTEDWLKYDGIYEEQKENFEKYKSNRSTYSFFSYDRGEDYAWYKEHTLKWIQKLEGTIQFKHWLTEQETDLLKEYEKYTNDISFFVPMYFAGQFKREYPRVHWHYWVDEEVYKKQVKFFEGLVEQFRENSKRQANFQESTGLDFKTIENWVAKSASMIFETETKWNYEKRQQFEEVSEELAKILDKRLQEFKEKRNESTGK